MTNPVAAQEPGEAEAQPGTTEPYAALIYELKAYAADPLQVRGRPDAPDYCIAARETLLEAVRALSDRAYALRPVSGPDTRIAELHHQNNLLLRELGRAPDPELTAIAGKPVDALRAATEGNIRDFVPLAATGEDWRGDATPSPPLASGEADPNPESSAALKVAGEALKNLALAADCYLESEPDDRSNDGGGFDGLTLGDLRRAREALRKIDRALSSPERT